MVVGAWFDRVRIGSITFSSAGSAYIFTRASTTATTYTRRTQMLHTAPASADYCGIAVAG
jgi:hypothetical protein